MSAEREMTDYLRSLPLSGMDSADSERMTELARAAQANVTWRKVSPYVAEVYWGSFIDDEDASAHELINAALIAWVEHQLGSWWDDDYEAAHLEIG